MKQFPLFVPPGYAQLDNNENPFERAALLASALYDSPDAHLLPQKGTL